MHAGRTVPVMRPEGFDHDEPAQAGLELERGEAAWRQYAGKVIAIGDGGVGAVAESGGEPFDAIDRLGLEEPLVLSVRGGTRG